MLESLLTQPLLALWARSLKSAPPTPAPAYRNGGWPRLPRWPRLPNLARPLPTFGEPMLQGPLPLREGRMVPAQRPAPQGPCRNIWGGI